ncbi:MAG: ABC transporter substrate-binding protein [Rhodobacteraceae bacterium]|nr:ABC transporter substrate-binding protein [Paracoccaceae bacterium]
MNGIRTSLAVVAATLVCMQPAAAQDSHSIGFTAALSGDFAAFGVNMRRGVELAMEEIAASGGPSFNLVIADDRGEAREGVLIAQRFCSDSSVAAVLGYSFSSIALAAVPIYDQCGLPVVGSAVTSPDLSGASPWFRRNILTDAVQGAMMGEYAATELGLSTVYVIHQQDDYGIGVANAFSAAATAAGMEVIDTATYLLGARDFRTQMTRARAARPDAIFIGGFYSEASKIAEQARDLGISAQILGTDGSLNPELITLGGPAVEGMIVYGMFDPSVATPPPANIIHANRARVGGYPHAVSARGYDAMMVTAEAIRMAEEGGDFTRAALNDAFGAIDAFPGVTGPTTFDAQGDRDGALYFLRVEDGTFTLAD